MTKTVTSVLFVSLFFAASVLAQEIEEQLEYTNTDVIAKCEQEAKDNNLVGDELDVFIDDCIYESEEESEQSEDDPETDE